jgi:hypothetical protein
MYICINLGWLLSPFITHVCCRSSHWMCCLQRLQVVRIMEQRP